MRAENGHWRIHLKEKQAINDDRCNFLHRGSREIQLLQVTYTMRKVTRGLLWWKKTIDEEKEDSNLLYVFSRRIFDYAEWIEHKDPFEEIKDKKKKEKQNR